MAVQEATARAAYGERHAAWSTDEIRAFYVDQKDERRIAWAVVVDGAVVGHLELQIPLADNTHRAAVDILVHPESRRRGIGSALLDVAERVARAEGREVMGAESDVATDRDDPAAGFAARHGYTAEQTELRSDLELPLAEGVLAATTAEADEHASGYEVLTSWDGIPDEWLADRPPSRDLECAGERADAAGQPRAGLRGRRTAHRMAAQARLTSRPTAF